MIAQLPAIGIQVSRSRIKAIDLIFQQINEPFCGKSDFVAHLAETCCSGGVSGQKMQMTPVLCDPNEQSQV